MRANAENPTDVDRLPAYDDAVKMCASLCNVIITSYCAAPPGQCTGNHEVACNNGHCVPIEYRCDGDDDCGDGTDERGCRKLVMNISMMMVTVMSAI